MKNRIILFLAILIFFTACESWFPDRNSTLFEVDEHHFLKNGIPFIVKGVVYVPYYPGYLPQTIEEMTTLPEQLQQRFFEDIRHIKGLGANTIRLWGAPRACYDMIDSIGGLHIIQTIWIDGSVNDLQSPEFKETTRAYIRRIVDRIHGAFEGQPPVIAYLVGNEISESTIQSTNDANPGITSFHGEYIKANGLSASEAFIAEIADYLKSYESNTYGALSLVSYANDIRTTYKIDTPFLDFRCQNAYSYAVPYYRWGTQAGSTSGTQFQGWLEEVKAIYPNMPLLVTETGLSVSPNAPSAGPPNYSYGGNSESEQAVGIIQNLNDIETTSLPLAGVCIHEYLDAWWKYGEEDSRSQDPDDIEEWFGMAKFVESESGYITEFRPLYNALKNLWNPTDI